MKNVNLNNFLIPKSSATRVKILFPELWANPRAHLLHVTWPSSRARNPYQVYCCFAQWKGTITPQMVWQQNKQKKGEYIPGISTCSDRQPSCKMRSKSTYCSFQIGVLKNCSKESALFARKEGTRLFWETQFCSVLSSRYFVATAWLVRIPKFAKQPSSFSVKFKSTKKFRKETPFKQIDSFPGVSSKILQTMALPADSLNNGASFYQYSMLFYHQQNSLISWRHFI